MISATKMLREEHDTILEMLGSLEAIVQRFEAHEAVAIETLNEFTDFFVLFADRSHHGKEEHLLFPLMERKGVPRAGGPLGCMLAEHDEGRAYIHTMKQNTVGSAQGDESARKLWAGAARGYSTLLRNHIWKENEILFPIAERILSPEEQTSLAAQFAHMQREKLDPEAEARLLHTKQKMAREFAAVAQKN
jgi:hemerythrin-like domain-containing protein